MLKCYTGVPGSGKSLHACRNVVGWLEDGKNVIANFPVKVNLIKKNRGHFFYQPNEKITVPFLMQFAQTMHYERQEGQTLIVFDEASVKFNSRTFMDSDRLDFLSFFAQHRHYGYEIIMITQNLHQIDRQVRDLCEIEVHHRNARNYKMFRFFPLPLFIAVERNLSVKDKNSAYFFTYRRIYGDLYDTYFEFNHKIVPEYSAAVSNDILNSEIIPAGGHPITMKNPPKEEKKQKGFSPLMVQPPKKTGRSRIPGRGIGEGPPGDRARPDFLVEELFEEIEDMY